MKKKDSTVYSFDVRFTGKQAKAIEAVAKTKGITPEAMVRQAVRDALDRANNKAQDKGLENYVLKLLGTRQRPGHITAAQRAALERRVLASMHAAEAPGPKKKR